MSNNNEESEKFKILQYSINVKQKPKFINILKVDQKYEDFIQLNNPQNKCYFCKLIFICIIIIISSITILFFFIHFFENEENLKTQKLTSEKNIILNILNSNKYSVKVNITRDLAKTFNEIRNSTIKNRELLIHVICHSHNDPGWLTTMDNYYLGISRLKVSVKKILDNMVISLSNNKERKFSYVEMIFFSRWYYNQTEEIKQKVKEFIKEGRLEIINGGWVMHDEACSHYKHLLDNMRIGFNFLKKEFNIIPKIGWFIDDFGHSATNSILLIQMGFENIVLTRLNHQEKKYRIENHNLEFIYDPFKQNQKIFTHISYFHYNIRKVLNKYYDDKIIDLNEKQLKDACEKFYQLMLEESIGYKHNNLMLYFGDDFTFQKADINYKNIEMIMNYVNNNMKGKMKMIYSTPSQYFDYVKKSNVKFEVYKNHDFFPYSDNDHSFWTGYFSSREYLKGLIKQLGLYTNTANLLLFEIFCNKELSKNNKSKLEKAIEYVYNSREKLALLQHHDAITGTSVEKTSEDFEKIAKDGINKLKHEINFFIYILSNFYQLEINNNITYTSCGYEEKLFIKGKENGNKFLIVNPGLNENHFFNYRLDIFEENQNISYVFKIKQEDSIIYGNSISFNDITIGLKYSSLQFIYRLNRKSLIIPTIITRTNEVINKIYFSDLKENSILKIKNGTLLFDCKSLIFNNTKSKVEFSLSHGYYTSYTGLNSNIRPKKSNPDGAYVFAPCENELQRNLIDKTRSFYQQNYYFTSIILRYKTSYLIIIIQNDNLNIYTESIFDPTNNAKPEKGYNYILVLDSNINNINKQYNKPQIYTDSQGINMMQRIKDTHPTFNYTVTEKISSNFYPITYLVSLRDVDNRKNKISIYSDRAEGVGVIEKGQIQIICHRYSISDDWKGIFEALFEISSMKRYFSVRHFISFDDKNNYHYFNNVPIITNANINFINFNNKTIISNVTKFFEGVDNIDIEFKVKNYREIFVQFENLFCDYFSDYGNMNEKIIFNKNGWKIKEYKLNGVDELNNDVKNGEIIDLQPQKFKLFLFSN